LKILPGLLHWSLVREPPLRVFRATQVRRKKTVEEYGQRVISTENDTALRKAAMAR